MTRITIALTALILTACFSPESQPAGLGHDGGFDDSGTTSDGGGSDGGGSDGGGGSDELIDGDGDGYTADVDCDDDDADIGPEQDWYEDNDGDGYGDEDGTSWRGCDYEDNVRVPNNKDCNDIREVGFDINPGVDEDCATDYDDNCDVDGDTNNIDAVGCTTFYYDEDGDGYGIETTECRCEESGYYRADNDEDCLDYDIAGRDGDNVNPDAMEVNGNDFDDNCNDMVDQRRATLTWSGSQIEFKTYDESNPSRFGIVNIAGNVTQWGFATILNDDMSTTLGVRESYELEGESVTTLTYFYIASYLIDGEYMTLCSVWGADTTSAMEAMSDMHSDCTEVDPTDAW